MALTADLRQPSPSPLQLKCCCWWVALYPLLIPFHPSFFVIFFFLCLTSLRAGSRTCWWCSCSGPAPSSCRPPPGEARRSLAPGRRRAPRSGSPSAAGRPESASQPRCSWCAGSSTCRPVIGRRWWHVGVCGEEGKREERRGEEEERVGHEGSVMWCERKYGRKEGKVATAEYSQLHDTKISHTVSQLGGVGCFYSKIKVSFTDVILVV